MPDYCFSDSENYFPSNICYFRLRAHIGLLTGMVHDLE